MYAYAFTCQEEKKRLEAQRDALIEALHKKAVALVDLCPPHPPSPPPPQPRPGSIPTAAAAGADSAADTRADPTAEDPETQGLSVEGGPGGNQQVVSPAEGNQVGGAQGWTLFGAATGKAESEEDKEEQVAGGANVAPGGADVALGGGVVEVGKAEEELTGEVKGVGIDLGEEGGGNGGDAAVAGGAAEGVSGGAGGGGTKQLPELEAQEALQLFEETYEELRRWCDMSPSKYGLIQVSKERLAGRPACALKVSCCIQCIVEECF